MTGPPVLKKGAAATPASQGRTCAVDGNPLPPNRTRYCSEQCALRFKRKQTRARRAKQHRHRWQCLDCGARLRLGRKRVDD